jgi:hypothetical protein
MSSKETAEAIFIVLKRVMKWVGALALIFVLIVMSFYGYSELDAYYKNRPQLVKNLKGIELGEKFQTFMFRNAGFVLDSDRNKKATDVIYYDNKEKSTAVAIEDNKVVRVLYGCMEKFEYSSVNGIDCRSTGDGVFDKYEKDIRVQCLRDKGDGNYLNYRVYDAVAFGIRYHVVSNEVVAFDIATPAELKNSEGFMNKKWTACE